MEPAHEHGLRSMDILLLHVRLGAGCMRICTQLMPAWCRCVYLAALAEKGGDDSWAGGLGWTVSGLSTDLPVKNSLTAVPFTLSSASQGPMLVNLPTKLCIAL